MNARLEALLATSQSAWAARTGQRPRPHQRLPRYLLPRPGRRRDHRCAQGRDRSEQAQRRSRHHRQLGLLLARAHRHRAQRLRHPNRPLRERHRRPVDEFLQTGRRRRQDDARAGPRRRRRHIDPGDRAPDRPPLHAGPGPPRDGQHRHHRPREHRPLHRQRWLRGLRQSARYGPPRRSSRRCSIAASVAAPAVASPPGASGTSCATPPPARATSSATPMKATPAPGSTASSWKATRTSSSKAC